jgi:hypothetical protein
LEEQIDYQWRNSSLLASSDCVMCHVHGMCSGMVLAEWKIEINGQLECGRSLRRLGSTVS